ncbi:MAG TPA: hypothetical protein VEU07_10450, partial [Candidatus Acidoferrum sp.]|nr:hypothetical protein [Candidatus Acidoferrum sp.]
ITAAQLDSNEIYAGRSGVMTPEEQARRIGHAWDNLPETPKHTLRYRVVDPDGQLDDFYLGAHAPSLTSQDIDLIHRLWLDVTERGGAEGVHHRDVVALALSSLAEELQGPARGMVLAKLTAGAANRQAALPTREQQSHLRGPDISIPARI